jgi:hypothetical protein
MRSLNGICETRFCFGNADAEIPPGGAQVSPGGAGIPPGAAPVSGKVS